MTDVRRLTSPADLAAVERLYADVFGGALNQRLVIGLIRNGGHLLGAYDDGRLVGYGLSFPAVARRRRYHYSQTVGIAPDAQGRGLGRAIKQAQRAAALDEGVDLLRWVFDPDNTRNAHFNTDVLGARITEYHCDFYGEGTDRLCVEWALADPPAPVQWTAPDLAPGHTKQLEQGLALAAPVAANEVRAALADGLVGVSCRSGVYLFAPT